MSINSLQTTTDINNQNWSSVRLDQLVDKIEYGFTASATNEPVGPKFLRITDIQDGKVNWETVPYCNIDVKSESKLQLKSGDIVFARTGATTGKSYLIDKCPRAVFASYLIRVRCKPELVSPRFLAMFFQTADYWEQIVDKSQGIGQPNCNGSKLASLEIPICSLEMQETLVESLTLLFDQVNVAKVRLSTIPALLKKFRQSVLAAAWHEAAEGGDIKDLADICESLTDGDHQPPPKTVSGIPFITISALEGAILNIAAAKRFVPYSYLDSLDPKRKAKPGDVLYSVTGSIGVPALVESDEPFVFQRHIAILRPDRSRASSKFLYYLLLSEQALTQGRDCATGIAQMTIPLRGLRKYQVPVPSLEAQAEIVCRVESLFALADSIESRLAEATAQVERTTQAILSKAFRGEL